MKKTIIIAAILITICGYAEAQFGGHYSTGFKYGYRPNYSARYFAPVYANPYWGYPNYYGSTPYVRPAPTKLDKEIANIQHEADEKIASVRMDHSLKGKERRADISRIKASRDLDIENAKRSYYKS